MKITGAVQQTLPNVLNVLGVLNVPNVPNVLNVLNISMDASLACWAFVCHPFFYSFSALPAFDASPPLLSLFTVSSFHHL